jgi:transmembrane sensor
LNQIKIHAQQLVVEALSLMRTNGINTLPVYDKGQFIGKITYTELMAFLDHKDGAGDINAHKMNFDVKTAMVLIKKAGVDPQENVRRKMSFPKKLFIGLSSVAVVSFLLISITRLFFVQDRVVSAEKEDMSVSTAGKVVLKLFNGQSIVLNETKTGLVVDGSKLSYSDGSPISYQKPETSNKSILYKDRWVSIPENEQQMILNVPSGGMYRVVLPDGSRVWLNAASKLKFPATFKGDDKRLVELTGEAYFEIAKVMYRPHGKGGKEERMPFIVVTNTQEIEVLGTNFNVYAYDNEKSVKTTLVEGSIRLRPVIQMGKLPGTLDPSSLDPMQVENGKRVYGDPILLKPNQESTLTGSRISVKSVDANEAYAWTDGEYIFRNASLETVMHIISRWYDVEVVYEDEKVGEVLLGGAISRSSKMSDVLEMLEVTANIHFKIGNKKITVLK